MKLRIMSDLHLEFHNSVLHMNPGPDEILILAGDIALAKKSSTYVDFFKDVAPKFKQILYIMGNHEHYKGSFKVSKSKLKEKLSCHKNVHVLEKQAILIDNVLFVACTLWTDFDKQNPIAMEYIRVRMNDYQVIRTGEVDEYARKLWPLDTYNDHVRAVNFMDRVLENMRDYKSVVITHHAPSFKSISEHYAGDFPMNYGYYTEMSDFILDKRPDLWVHGHMHHSNDYRIGETRVVSNPRGYPWGRHSQDKFENPKFDPNFTIEI